MRVEEVAGIEQKGVCGGGDGGKGVGRVWWRRWGGAAKLLGIVYTREIGYVRKKGICGDVHTYVDVPGKQVMYLCSKQAKALTGEETWGRSGEWC